MAGDLGDTRYRLKRISFRGNELPILMQNENGPCPLLALSNVLLLRGSIFVHPDVSEITFEELTARLADYMLDANELPDDNPMVCRRPRMRAPEAVRPRSGRS